MKKVDTGVFGGSLRIAPISVTGSAGYNRRFSRQDACPIMTDAPPEPLSTDTEENHARFIAEALDTGCVWGLQHEDGWALSASEKYESTEVMPFWSQPEFAEAHRRDEWSAYQVVPVSLEEFLEDWLPGMHEDVFLVGVNWDAGMEGLEVEPLDLLQEIEQELQ